MAKSGRVALSLYRSFLRWAKSPLHQDIPIAAVLRSRKEADNVGHYVQTQFREQRKVTDQKKIKQLLDVGFAGLRHLNGLDTAKLRKSREDHKNREGVIFHIGQVVRDTVTKNRGVIFEWVRPVAKDGTIKPPEYRLLVDEQESTPASPVGDTVTETRVLQENLEPTPAWEHRISHGALDYYFEYYDAQAERFVPNPNLKWKYPSDTTGTGNQYRASEASYRNAALWVQRWAKKLDGMIAELIKASTSSASPPEEFKSLPRFLPVSDESQFEDLRRRIHPLLADCSSTTWNPSHLFDSLRLLNDITRTSQDIVALARKRHIDREDVKYSVGQVFRHKKFKFRFVIHDWNVRPVMDVSNWDGVVGLARGGNQPFYLVIPDHDDCVNYLGGPRDHRYVAEDNLEPLDVASCRIDHELLHIFFSSYDRKTGCYIPHLLNQYMFPADVTCRLSPSVISSFDSIVEFLRYDSEGCPSSDLANILCVASSKIDASVCEAALQGNWASHPVRDIQDLFEKGNDKLRTGKLSSALAIFDRVLQRDPNYVECWNKLAMAQFRAGNLREAHKSATRLLELVPNHLEGYKRLGDICLRNQNLDEAILCYEKVLDLNPWADDAYLCKREAMAKRKSAEPRPLP